MLSYTTKLKLDKANDPTGGTGAPPASPETPPAAPTQPPVTPPAPPNSPAPKAAGSDDKLDDLGYAPRVPQPGDKDYIAPKPGKENPPEPKPPQAPEEIKDPATGYGIEPPKGNVEPPKPPEPPAVPDEFDTVVEGLPKDEAGRIKEFAKKNALTVAQVKAFSEVRKVELANDAAALLKSQKDAQNEALRTRTAWHKELKDDSAFGGDMFAKNIGLAEKVLADFMPQTKKILTERGGILPPYVMRDLAKMAEKLYGSSEKLTQGDPPAPEVPKKTPNDEALEFYQ